MSLDLEGIKARPPPYATAADHRALVAEVERLTAQVAEAEANGRAEAEARLRGVIVEDNIGIENLRAELATARAETNGYAQQAGALRRERDEARERAKKEVATKVWVVDRIEAELRRAGVELHWTDGGGSDCPGGWHRNPYLSVGNIGELSKRAAELEHDLAAIRADLDLHKAALAEAQRRHEEACCEALRLREASAPVHGLMQLAQRVASASEPRLAKYATAARELLATMKVDETLAAHAAPSSAAEAVAAIEQRARAKALEEAEQAIIDTDIETVPDRDRPTQVCHDDATTTLRTAVENVRALAKRKAQR